jgi:hypothetical protein
MKKKLIRVALVSLLLVPALIVETPKPAAAEKVNYCAECISNYISFFGTAVGVSDVCGAYCG